MLIIYVRLLTLFADESRTGRASMVRLNPCTRAHIQSARKGTTFFSNTQIISYNSRNFLFSVQLFAYLTILLYLCTLNC